MNIPFFVQENSANCEKVLFRLCWLGLVKVNELVLLANEQVFELP